MTRSIRNQLTRSKLEDRATAIRTYLGTIILLMSGCILYADKVINYFNIQIDYEFRYYVDLDSFIWTLSGTIAPLFIVAAYFFKPKKWALASPLAAYSVQLLYVLRDEHFIHREYFWYYTIFFVIFFYALIFFIQKGINRWASRIKSSEGKIQFLMNLFNVQADKKNLIKDDKRWDEEILKPALKKLDE